MLLLLLACRGPDLPDPTSPVDDQVEIWLAQMTLEEKVEQMHGAGVAPVDGLWMGLANERLGIPAFAMSDGPRGVTAGTSTTFPVAMLRGATFDPELETRVGEAMAKELRAKGGNVLLAPAINLLRHPAWGRAQETYGEDSHHLGRMGVAMTHGIQRHALASVKHFAANSIEDTRFDVDVTIDERALREVYLPHFRAVVEGGEVASVMSAYNLVNGYYCAENPDLLGILDEWGFEGFVESDWILGTRSTVDSALAGLDLEMPASNWYGPALVAAVDAGDVPIDRIDEAVRDLLRQKIRFGLDAPESMDPSVIESPEHVALAREVAQGGIVLLRNEGDLLPLTEGAAIAVVGGLADVANLGDRGSSAATPTVASTPLEGLEARFSVTSIPTDTLTPSDEASVAASSAAVVVVGLTSDDEGENLFVSGGDRDTLALSAAHVALIGAVSALQPRTIVVVEGGSAITMAEWIDAPQAVLFAFYPGMEGGTALADLVVGDVAPSGRLPFTIPIDEADLPPFDHAASEVAYDAWHGYRHLDRTGTSALFPFGFGLGYGSVVYESMVLPIDTLDAADTVTATVTVHNPTDRTLREVVQLYVGAPGPDRAVRALAAFDKVTLLAGERREVTLAFPLTDVAWWSAGWIVEPGSYRIDVGRSVADLELTSNVTVR